VVLGLSRQLIGQADFGVRQYRYCGSILGSTRFSLFSRQAELLEVTRALATVVTREFHLFGLNGIDFIARGGVPYLIEVNPRYSASMELVERATGMSMFDLHVDACEGNLPAPVRFDWPVEGKAIVFARQAVRIGQTPAWWGGTSMADLPHPGEHIASGRPICTVFARARTPEQCHRLLRARAAAVYRAVRSRAGRAA
jgi:uncharacterized protein